VLDAHEPVTSLAFRPGGRQLAVGVGSTVQLWNLGTGVSSPADELDAGARVSGVAYSPDGRSLVVAAGRTVQLWDLGVSDPATSIANPAVLRDHGGPVTSVAFSPDGSRFASASQDGTARVWLSLDALVDLGCDTVGRNLTQEEWRQLLPGDPYQKTCEQWPEGA
jgi:WD40 repeat protein